MSDSCSVLIIGAGNECRRDDGIGIMTVRHLIGKVPDNVSLIEGLSDSTILLDLWHGIECVYLIDAVRSGGRPGQIYKLDSLMEDMPVELRGNFSTHTLGISEVIELGKNLGKLPERLIIFGIEGKNFSPGSELTPEVEEAGLKISEMILGEIKNADQ